MIITGEAVVTIHRRPNDALSDLREHYDDQHIRSEQFLVYKILDAITSTFIPVLTRIDDDIDEYRAAGDRRDQHRAVAADLLVAGATWWRCAA